MKKIILSIALLAGISASAQAQSIKYGLKAGASLTSITGSDVDGNAYKFGFNGGGVVNFGLNDMISIQPEVLFSMKGAKSKDDSNERINLNYIDVPVLLKVSTGATGLFFEAGPQLGFRVSSSYKYDPVSIDFNSYTKAVDFGYAAGLGFQAESGPMVGLRYNGGFTNVGKSGTMNGYPVTAGSAKNSAFQLYVGFMFGGK
jgi:hypothetical protein